MPKPTITLHTPLTEFHGVGPTRAAALAKLGLHTTADLLAYFPRDYEDRTLRESIAVLPPDAPAAVSALMEGRGRREEAERTDAFTTTPPWKSAPANPPATDNQ